MKHFIEIPNNLGETNKIEKIRGSLNSFKSLDKFEKEALKDVNDETSLKNKLKEFSRKAEDHWIGGYLWPQGLVDGGIDLIVDEIMGSYNELSNKLETNIGDFVSENYDSVISLFTGNKISHEQLEIRYIVDTVFSVGYSFRMNSDRKYEIIDDNGNHIESLDKNLISINGGKVHGAEFKSKKEILDDVLLERSFTGRGTNIKEMYNILAGIGINPENPEELNNITPELIGKAYIKYYAKLAGVPEPDINNPTSIDQFLKNTKVINLKIPIERITYIRLYANGVFDKTYTSDQKNNDVQLFKDMMNDFSKLTKGTEENLKVFKEISSKTGKMLDKGLGGLMEYMNGPEGLILLGGMIYLLFFSNHKKEAWMSLTGLAGANVLIKAYKEDHNSGVAQLAAEGFNKIGAHEMILPTVLKGIDQTRIGETKQKANTIGILADKSLSDIKKKITIDSNGNIKIDMTVFDSREISALEKVWGGRYEQEVEKLLTEFFGSTEMNRFTSKNNINDNIDYLINNKFSGKNISFSLVVAHVMLWNISNTTSSTNPNTAPAISSTVTLSNIPNNIQVELDKINVTDVKDILSPKIDLYFQDTTNTVNKGNVTSFLKALINTNPSYKATLQNILNAI